MGLIFATDPAYVRTPATSANLGPGFDTLGLALTRYDDLSAHITAGELIADRLLSPIEVQAQSS